MKVNLKISANFNLADQVRKIYFCGFICAFAFSIPFSLHWHYLFDIVETAASETLDHHGKFSLLFSANPNEPISATHLSPHPSRLLPNC